MPKISVVMPTYNAGQYLREAIDSILGQTFEDFEFLIVDDNSTDNTLEIIGSYKDSRIKLINGPRRGLSAALNYGIDLSGGEYIARMDADDIALPLRFEKQVEFMDKHPKYGVCGVRAQHFSGKYELGLYGARHVERPGLIDQLVCSVVLHSAVMFRKETLLHYGLRYDEDYLTCEDQELWSRALRYTEFYNIQEPLMRRRKNLKGASTVKAKEGEESFAKIKLSILSYLFPSATFNKENLDEHIAEIIEVFMRNEPREKTDDIIKLLNMKASVITPPPGFKSKYVMPVVNVLLPKSSARRELIRRIYYKLRGGKL